jgi:hypothetical protein
MAYGKVRSIPKPLGDIPARIYPIESNASEARAAILTISIDFNAGDELDANLVTKLQHDFNEYVATYLTRTELTWTAGLLTRGEHTPKRTSWRWSHTKPTSCHTTS